MTAHRSPDYHWPAEKKRGKNGWRQKQSIIIIMTQYPFSCIELRLQTHTHTSAPPHTYTHTTTQNTQPQQSERQSQLVKNINIYDFFSDQLLLLCRILRFVFRCPIIWKYTVDMKNNNGK